MGQENSVPIRCNACHRYYSSIKTSASSQSQATSSSTHKTAPSPVRSSSRTTNKSTKSSQSSKSTVNTSHTRPSRHSTASSTASPSYKRIDHQTKYLNHQLCIKSCLDIIEEGRTTALKYKPMRNGIRNYTPQILAEQTTPPSASASASSTSSDEQDDIDIWI